MAVITTTTVNPHLIINSLGKITVTWKIDNFALHNVVGKRIISPPFLTPSFGCSEEWFLVCWPNGIEIGTSHLVAFALYSKNKIEIKYRIKIKGFQSYGTSNGYPVKSEYFQFNGTTFSGTNTLLSRSRIYEPVPGRHYSTTTLSIIKDDALWVDVIMKRTIIEKTPLTKAISSHKSDTSNYLLRMLGDESSSDIKICGEACELYAHKCILSARSPVFKAMFSSDMKENVDNVVKIEGLDDEIIEEMFNYMYSGNPLRLAELADRLVTAADRYQLDGLKELCQLQLIEQLNVDNVLSLFSIAAGYNLEKLKKSCLCLFNNEIRSISKIPDCNMTLEDPEFSKEFLKYFMDINNANELEDLPFGSSIN